MGLPAKRRTKQSKRERASHFALSNPALTTCSHCGKRIAPHRVCPHCGYYRGKPVAAVVTRLEQAAAKRVRRHQHAHDGEGAKKASDTGTKEEKGTETTREGKKEG